MNGAHLHLVLNHLPIIIPIVGVVVLIGGFIVRSEIVKRTAFAIFILASLSAIAAFATGDGAEDAVKHLPGVTEQLIHTHEETATIFSVAIYILGGLSLIALWANWKQKRFADLFSFTIIILSVVVLFFARQTGTTGGEIRHTEIRTDSLGKQMKPGQTGDDD